MSKKRKVKVFSFQGFDVAHYKTTEQFAVLVSTLYDKATAEIAQVAANGSYKANKPFSFADYPKVGAVINNIVGNLTKNVEAVISVGARKQWLFACQKNDEFLKSIIDTSILTKQQMSKYQDRNLDALKSFQDRKVGGMNLSQRVWKYTEQYKEQIEIALDVGLGEGKSAAQLSRDVRQNLNDPDRLFKRVQDKRGNLQLSKSAKAFHPGTGVYRSAYKNAMRLTRSEINMAYRESDWLRWQQLDFVVGFEVKRSNREPVCECKLCERLVGKYPKWFKFKGWHPQCLCHAIPIIEDYNSKERSEDRRNALRAALYGTEYKKYVSPNTITDLPDEFKAWVSENMERQNNWASTPYFIKDNFKNGKLAEGLICVPNLKPIKVINEHIIDITAQYAGTFSAKSEHLANKMGIQVTPVNLKSKKHIIEKAIRDYRGDVSLVSDIIRNTFIADNDKIPDIIAEIKKQFNVIQFKAQFSNDGYTGYLFKILVSDGIKGEIQINTPQMIYAKEVNAREIIGDSLFDRIKEKSGLLHGLGHKYYEQYRTLSDADKQSKIGQDLIEKSKKYYGRISQVKL